MLSATTPPRPNTDATGAIAPGAPDRPRDNRRSRVLHADDPEQAMQDAGAVGQRFNNGMAKLRASTEPQP